VGEFDEIESGETASRLYIAGEPSTGAAGVLVLHPWWGLNQDVIAYVDRLAGAGFVVAAPDLFGGQVASTIEDADRLAGAADEEAVDGIVLAAVDRLADLLGPTGKLGTLGFSFGAHWAMWSPAQRDRVVASVVYYGSTGGPILSQTSVPVLGHFAETDPYETDEGVAAFEDTLRTAGRDVVIDRYPGTGHWFAEPSRDAYRAEAADLAFDRTVAFLRKHLDEGRPAG
jgi:carboxymethylenebutenolidase